MLFKLLFVAQFSRVKGNDDFIPLSELACLHKLTSEKSENSEQAWGVTIFPQNLPTCHGSTPRRQLSPTRPLT